VSLRKSVKKWLYGSCPGFAGSFPYFGTRVYFPKGSLIFEGACEQGIWEKDLVGILISLARPNTTYFDIGANIGLTSIPVLFSCPECRAVSFEPSPGALPYLQRTTEGSGYGDRWLAVGKALGDKIGRTDFFTSPSAASIFDGMRDTKRTGKTKKISVPVTTLDVEWAALNYPKVSVIKIDVEGAELQTIRGALQCIAREQPLILFEWNATNLQAYDCDPQSILYLAQKLGYRLFSLPGLLPVPDSTMLILQMLLTESFILVPTKKNATYC
jgi:FkbM family methyltransferase